MYGRYNVDTLFLPSSRLYLCMPSATAMTYKFAYVMYHFWPRIIPTLPIVVDDDGVMPSSLLQRPHPKLTAGRTARPCPLFIHTWRCSPATRPLTLASGSLRRRTVSICACALPGSVSQSVAVCQTVSSSCGLYT